MFREREEVERQILVYWKARWSGPRLWKTSTIQDGTQKNFGGGEEGERRRRSTSLPAEALCSGGVNCKRDICKRGCFKLLGRKKKKNSLQRNVSLHIYAAGAEEWDGPSHEVYFCGWEKQGQQSARGDLSFSAALGKKSETTSWGQVRLSRLEHVSEGIWVKNKKQNPNEMNV